MRRPARDERADFAAFLATLPPPQWQAATLCAGWRVRDVAAHVISYDELGPRELLEYAVRGRFWSSRINAVALARYQALTPEELLALLMARALGRPRVIPPERLVTALRWAGHPPRSGIEVLWRHFSRPWPGHGGCPATRQS
jgi:uncharacterized protein (TIGR03083 family)